MTLSVAWTRWAGKHEELVFASDSRLRGFGAWDANPKIFQLARTDCAISFSGDTHFSYPLINQVQTFVTAYPKSQSRFQDLVHFKGHLINMVNYMLTHKSDEEVPDLHFLFGGYSWDRRKFVLWRIFFDPNIGSFTSSQVRKWNGIKTHRIVAVIGNYPHEFIARLREMLKGRQKLVRGYFDMEPFEVLRDMIRGNDFELIGGPPQLVKVYEHLNRTPISVKWRIGDNLVTALLGRPLQDYESSNYPVIDPDTLEIVGGNRYG